MGRGLARQDVDLAALADMPVAALRERWLATGSEPPSVPTVLLRRLLAQQLQERAKGGLPVMVVRELERVAGKQPLPAPVVKRPALTNGSRLIRDWNGQTIAVEVIEGGFLWNERVYRSLSDIAKRVTGAHWSGPRFFGVTRRGG